MIRACKTRFLSCLLAAGVSIPSSLFAAERSVSVGLNANFEQYLAQSAHVGWSRIDIVWRDVNPSYGVWDWAFTDAQVNNARSWGQEILAVLHYPPLWVGGGPNANIAPLTTDAWAEFVRRAAQRYVGKVAAYEIWNEPDANSTDQLGIGWGRSVYEPPLYVDFLYTAAKEIRANAPGTIVAGPAARTRSDGVNGTRKREIWKQINSQWYPDGTGHQFLDVATMHNNAGDTESSRSMGERLVNENISFRNNRCPPCSVKPIWVTEYGFRSNRVGEAGQREKICNLTRIYTGRLESDLMSYTTRNIQRAFIFVQKDNNDSASVFRSDNSPKPVVTQYLQQFAFPVVQPPAVSSDFPNCATGARSPEEHFEIGEYAWEALDGLGLADPRAAIPHDFIEAEAFFDVSTRTFFALFTNAEGGLLEVSAFPATDYAARTGEASDWSLRWNVGETWIDVVGLRGAEPLGRQVIERVGEAMMGTKPEGCVRSTSSPSIEEMSTLGLRSPVAPLGFTLERAELSVTRLQGQCTERELEEEPELDLAWFFRAKDGRTVSAGTYRYEVQPLESHASESSVHWLSTGGLRHWVSMSTSRRQLVDRAMLVEVARSLDPGAIF